jgi:4-amino-4-deoxy-L-arabinose transferase-like glycosyltransferase
VNSDKGLVRRERLGRWALGFLLVVFVLWEANHLEGFSRGYDEGLYLTIAQMVRSGYTLYREISHPHGPLFIYSIIPAFELLGASATVGRFVTVLYGAVGLLLVALTARELGGWLSGLSAVVLLSLAPEFFRLSRAAMPDVQSYTMTTLAILSSLRYLTTRRRKWLLLAGLAFGIGALFKLIVIPALVPLGLAVLCSHIRQEGLKSRHKLLGDAAIVLGTAILPPLVCLLIYGWQPLYYDLIAVSSRAGCPRVSDTPLFPSNGFSAFSHGCSGRVCCRTPRRPPGPFLETRNLAGGHSLADQHWGRGGLYFHFARLDEGLSGPVGRSYPKQAGRCNTFHFHDDLA